MTTSMVMWCRRNLFSTPLDTALSIIFIPLCVWVIGGLAEWTLRSARWDIITDNIRVLLVGTYPAAALWRTWLVAVVLCVLAGATIGLVFPIRDRPLQLGAAGVSVGAWVVLNLLGSVTIGWILACTAAAIGGWISSSIWPLMRRLVIPAWFLGLTAICAVLAPEGTDRWGGLLLSVLVTIIAAMLSFPIGVMLALGRRSRIPSLRICCTAYIELIRSVPLISVIYWAWIVVPLVLPPSYYVVDLVRGIAGFVIFFAAYVAEFVRGGLQGVPEGQVEAARSLGLSTIDVNRYIVLPQAIRAIIPALVGNVLDIFNNMPLVFIIGLTDFLKAGQTIVANPSYGGREYEVYAFLFVIYLLVGALISFAARKLEAKMGLGVR